MVTTFESHTQNDMNLGLDQEQPPHKIAPNTWSECENMWSLNGRKQRRTGYVAMGTNLPLNGAFMLGYQWVMLSGTKHLFAFTTRDIYKYNSGTDAWEFITEIYITGQASCAGGTTVTGAGTSWDTNWPSNVCQIKFGTQDPNGTGSPDTWYAIASVAGGTSINLTGNGPNTGGDVNYVIRVCWSGTVSDRFSIAPVTEPNKNRLYVVNNVNPIKYTLGSGTFTKLTGTNVPDTCRALLWLENRLVCYSTKESGNSRPQRVRRSVKGDPDDFSGSGSGFNDLVEDAHAIVTAKYLSSGAAVYKEGSILMQYTTQTSDVYAFDYVITAEGIDAPDAVVDMDQFHVVFGRTDVFIFNGTPNKIPVTQGIWSKIFGESGELNQTYKSRTFMTYVKELDKVLAFMPTQTEYPTRVYSFDPYRPTEPTWDKHTISNMTGCGFWDGTASAKKWTDLVGPWTAQTWRWSDKTLGAGQEILLLGDKDGNIYKFDLFQTKDNGTGIDVKLRTPELVVPGKKVRYGLLKFQACGESIDLYCSVNGGNSWSLLKSFTLTADPSTYRILVNKTVERFMVEWRSTGKNFVLDWYEGPIKIKELRA